VSVCQACPMCSGDVSSHDTLVDALIRDVADGRSKCGTSDRSARCSLIQVPAWCGKMHVYILLLSLSFPLFLSCAFRVSLQARNLDSHGNHVGLPANVIIDSNLIALAFVVRKKNSPRHSHSRRHLNVGGLRRDENDEL